MHSVYINGKTCALLFFDVICWSLLFPDINLYCNQWCLMVVLDTAQGGEISPFVKKKQHGRRSKCTDDDPASRVPVMSLDGQHVLSGNDAPALRDLEAWLEEHPNYAPIGDVRIFCFW